MIRATRLVEHRRPLSRPMASAVGRWSERRALLLEIEDGDGHIGRGEAAPLPGYSQDTLEDARQALRGLSGTALSDPKIGGDVVSALEIAVPGRLGGSARSALETACVDLWSRRAGKPAWALLTEGLPGAPAESLPLALWLPSEPQRGLEAAALAFERGVRSFKVKLEPGSEDGYSTLSALREHYGGMVELRADANRSLSPSELAARLPSLRELGLEWLEEPGAEFPTQPLGVPLALDESLDDGGVDWVRARAAGIVAALLKPTLLGGLSRSVRLAEAAARAGIACVASHALEGPLGFMAGAALARRLGAEFAHGLGLHPGLGGLRPPGLAESRDELVPWTAAGFGLGRAEALAGAELVAEERL